MKVLILINYLNNFFLAHSFSSFVITFLYHYHKQWLMFGSNYKILLFFPRRSHPTTIHSHIFDLRFSYHHKHHHNGTARVLGGIELSHMDRDILKRHTHYGLEMYVCRAHLQFYFCHSGMRKALGYGLKSF